MSSDSFNLSRRLDLLFAITKKELKARYKSTIFGFLWVVLNPLFQMIIIGAIFSFFVNIPNYFLFLFSGLLPWQFFTLSLTKATSCYVHQRSLLKKAYFPKEVIPISIVMSNFFHLVTALFILFIFLIITSNISNTNVALLLLGLFWLLTFTIGLILITSSLNVRYRDIGFFIQTIIILWFYATPILFSFSLVPDNIQILLSFNPLTSLFEIFHEAILNQGVIVSPTLHMNIAISTIVVILGIYIHHKQHKYFTDWL